MNRAVFCLSAFLVISLPLFAQNPEDFDVIIKGGTVYDGTGAEPRRADLAIRGDRIAGVGDFKTAKAKTIIDAAALAPCARVINMAFFANAAVVPDVRSPSEVPDG